MTDSESKILEAGLIRQIEELEQTIKQAQADKTVLERMLLKVRREQVALRDVTRINSASRILVEQKILDTLQMHDGGMDIKSLYRHALQIDGSLKENTFRSYLTRLKGRGLITNARRGIWQLA